MSESMHEYVVRCLRKLNRSTDLEPVEDATGVSRWTLQKIASGNIKNSRINTLQPVYDYFKRLEGRDAARRLRSRTAAA